MQTQPPKSVTAIVSIILMIIGIIIAALPLLIEDVEYLSYIGVILIIGAWLILLLGCLITGL